MHLIKKQRKDNGEAGAPEKKETTAKSAESKDTTAQNETTEPEKENGTENTNAEQTENTDSKDGKKELSETEFLKLYLQQSLEEVKKQKAENEKLKAELDSEKSHAEGFKDKLESIVKEYDNFRRRTAIEKENLGGEATVKAVSALLPALDNLERAMPFADSNPDSFKQGVEMTLRQLSDAFKSLGVEEIEAKGVEFNPEFHEAVMHVEDDSIGDSIITDVFQKGYKLGDRVVRHSVVKVAN